MVHIVMVLGSNISTVPTIPQCQQLIRKMISWVKVFILKTQMLELNVDVEHPFHQKYKYYIISRILFFVQYILIILLIMLQLMNLLTLLVYDELTYALFVI